MCLEQEHQEHNLRSKNTNPDIKKKNKKNRERTRHQEIEPRR